MDANKLKINNVLVTPTTSFDAHFQPTKSTVVRFYVGTHGPFELSFSPPELATPQAMRAGMDAKAEEMRRLFDGLE